MCQTRHVLGLLVLLGGCESSPTVAVDGPLAPDDMAVADLASPDVAVDQGPVDQGLEGDLLPETPLLAGAAVVDITPPIKDGVPLAGYGAEPRRIWTLATVAANLSAALGVCLDPSPGTVASLFEPAEGKHDPITARALVLQSGATKAAIVKVDTVGVMRQFFDDMAQAAKPLGIPRENLIIAATHTHSGPGAASNHGLLQLVAADCYHDPTYQKLLAGMKQALFLADAAREPARIGIASVEEKRVSSNRAGRPGIFDPELGLIKVVTLQGHKPIAAVINFAVHGTCLEPSNMHFSADLMGFAESELESRIGGGVAIYLNGAEGDVRPTQSGFSGAQALGGILAQTAGQLWAELATRPTLDIAGAFADVTAPPASYLGCMPLFAGDKTLCDYLPGVQLPIGLWMQKVLPFSALRLGDVVLVTVPGEPLTEVGWEIKKAGKQRGHRLTYVVGLANDYMGYVSTLAEYNKGEYEGQSTLYGPQTAAFVIGAATAQIDAVTPAP